MNILMFGDVVGVRASEEFCARLPEIVKEYDADFVCLNAENSASNGINTRLCNLFFDAGVNVITFGNHTFTRLKEFENCNEKFNKLVRPANYPEGAPGVGYRIMTARNNKKVCIINLIGRVFMQPQDCPFKCVEKIVDDIKGECDYILVDFHAEATSEKIAMGYWLDGKVTAVVGTHTHVQTADNYILPEGTAYMTDLGMIGAELSMLGCDKYNAMKRLIDRIPVKNEPADGDIVANGAFIIADEKGLATQIERVSIKL